MKAEYYISITLDTRKKLKSNKYPVKLRVYTPVPRRQKLYSTVFELSRKEFEAAWRTTKPRQENKPLRAKLAALEAKANEVAGNLSPFTFDKFEKLMFRHAGDGINVEYQFTEYIKGLKIRSSLNTVESYRFSLKSLKVFTDRSHDFSKLTFYDITPEWLREYERYMTETNGGSYTTVGIYLRCLRAVYNWVISEGDIDRDVYPFGKVKYIIPAGRKTKKALTKEELKRLFESLPETPEQEKARDFWFFSYACSGMNVKDFALLKYGNITDGVLEFYRAKTLNTAKGSLTPITVHLNPFASSVIAKYGNPDTGPDTFVFDIVNADMSPEMMNTRIKSFTRFINQHIKKLCVANDLPKDVSFYWARHSFATHSIRQGASMEFVQESLGHGNIKTTQNYFAGFDNETKEEFSKKIMNFE